MLILPAKQRAVGLCETRVDAADGSGVNEASRCREREKLGG